MAYSSSTLDQQENSEILIERGTGRGKVGTSM
jgi:hypothetical protein